MKAAYLGLHVRPQRNRAQFQRATDLAENFELFVFTRGPVCDEVAEAAVRTRQCPDSLLFRVLYPLWLVWHVLALRRRHTIEFVYTDHARQDLLAGAILQLLGYMWIAHIWDDPQLGHDIEGTPDSPSRRFARLYNRAVLALVRLRLEHADLIVVSQVPDILTELGVDPAGENVLAVTNGVDVEWTRQVSGEPTDAFEIVYVGPVQSSRDVETILQATAMAAEEGPNLRLTLLGRVADSTGRLIERYASSAPDGLTIDTPGFVDHQDALAAIERADVCLCTLRSNIRNHANTYPIKVFEYMALGTPVICTEMNGTAQIIDDGINGLLVPPEDPSALVSAIERLSADETLREELGANAWQDVEDYDWERINETISDRLESLLATNAN